MNQSVDVEELQFKWGKKREATGVENKDVEFYESFTYDGSEYCLYDCVVITGDSSNFFVGKIINIYQYNDQRENPSKVELLWFFKPCEISKFIQLEGLQDVLENELFLASGTGPGLANENPLEAISGKCNVLCISKDIRNPQPTYEEIKLADFLFHRTLDVTSGKFSEKIDDHIAGVDVKFIFNRTSCKKKTIAVQKVATGINGTADSLKPDQPSTSASLWHNEWTAIDLDFHCKSDYSYKKGQDNECHKQLARKKSTLAEERSDKDSGRHDSELDCCYPSGSKRDDFHGKKDQDCEVKKQLSKQKSKHAEERCSKDSYSLEDMPLKKRKLDGFVVVSDVRTKGSQKINHDDIRSSRDEGTGKDDYSQMPSVTGDIVRQNEHNGSDFSRHRMSDYGSRKEQDNGCHNQSVRKKSTVEEEWSNKDSGLRNGRPDWRNTSGSRRNDCRDKKDQEYEVTEQLANQKSRLAEGRCSKDSYSLDKMPQRKQKLDGYAAASYGRTKAAQKISHDVRKDIGSSRDKGTRREVYSQKPCFTEKNHDLRILRFSEGTETKHATEKHLFKKPNSECKISKNSEEKMLTVDNYRRDDRAFEVTEKPNVEEVKWLRSLSWEESLRDAEGQGTLVLLQNLDPTYTSNEVENIVYSALDEQCTARVIERTSYAIPHIGEALVILKTKSAAERAVRRLDHGCLLLSNGRTLVASHVKVNPPVTPSLQFAGHIKPITQKGRETRNAVATSHGSQKNTIEHDMAMEWSLLRERNKLTFENLYAQQIGEKKKLQIKFNPKRA